MKAIGLSILVVCFTILAACGPSEQEIRDRIAAEQATRDSLEHAEVMHRAQQGSLTLALIQWKGKLEAAESRLNDTKQFQFLRTESEKETQIQSAKEQVEILKVNIERTEAQIDKR
jgi:hypothetical protein